MYWNNIKPGQCRSLNMIPTAYGSCCGHWLHQCYGIGMLCTKCRSCSFSCFHQPVAPFSMLVFSFCSPPDSYATLSNTIINSVLSVCFPHIEQTTFLFCLFSLPSVTDVCELLCISNVVPDNYACRTPMNTKSMPHAILKTNTHLAFTNHQYISNLTPFSYLARPGIRLRERR